MVGVWAQSPSLALTAIALDFPAPPHSTIQYAHQSSHQRQSYIQSVALNTRNESTATNLLTKCDIERAADRGCAPHLQPDGLASFV
jgi:hypothetical protein